MRQFSIDKRFPVGACSGEQDLLNTYVCILLMFVVFLTNIYELQNCEAKKILLMGESSRARKKKNSRFIESGSERKHVSVLKKSLT